MYRDNERKGEGERKKRGREGDNERKGEGERGTMMLDYYVIVTIW